MIIPKMTLSFFKCYKHLIQRLCSYSSACQNCHQITERTTCVLLPGDGIGPELTKSVKCLFEAHSIPIELVTHVIKKKEDGTFYEAMEAIKKYGLCLKSSFDKHEPTLAGEYQNYNVRLINLLDIYANVAHIQTLPNVKTKHKDLSLIVVREQTEASYSNLEHESVKGVVESLKIVTTRRSKRIAKFAFDYATKFGRKTVTCVHKANIMKMTDGLFLKCCHEISKLYPKIKFNSIIVDNCMMQLVSNPSQFDVLVTPNLYGSMADNLCAGLVGGAGVVPGAAYGDDCVVFEPAAHHTFYGAVGKNVANPTAMLLCAAKLLWHVNMRQEAATLKCAVRDVLKKGRVRTADIGGKACASEFTDAVINTMHKLKCEEKAVFNL